MTIKRCLLLFSGFLSLTLSPLYAHNGALAVAVPIDNIAIDGDLSDWPQDLEHYPIGLPEFGTRPRDKEDLRATFRLGYNLEDKALYIAVEVQDESIVVLGDDGRWNNQDGCDIYVDLAHRDGKSAVRQYALWGTTRDVFATKGTVAHRQEVRWK
jgi:hypothetical protein